MLIVMDSVGIGEMPDAANFGDEGSNTLGNMAEELGGLNLPNLASLGLGKINYIKGVTEDDSQVIGRYGKLNEVSPGKDTTTGHWEIAGIFSHDPFPTFPNGFSQEFIKAFEERIGRKTLGNVVASGTTILEELGQDHVETGYPIVYTSADSVFQIAAHEEVIPLEELYKICKIAREMLKGDLAVGRVIARPFVGEEGSFTRTANRHDYSLKPTEPTLLDYIKAEGKDVFGVGKISDIFANEGITKHFPSKNNMEGIDVTLKAWEELKEGLVFTNLVDFDMLFGHRNNVQGYANALKEFDKRIPELLEVIGEDDLLIISADHGCDPTTESTDHSREYVPVLVYQKNSSPEDLGIRESFADVAATIADFLDLKKYQGAGTSFLK